MIMMMMRQQLSLSLSPRTVSVLCEAVFYRCGDESLAQFSEHSLSISFGCPGSERRARSPDTRLRQCLTPSDCLDVRNINVTYIGCHCTAYRIACHSLSLCMSYSLSLCMSYSMSLCISSNMSLCMSCSLSLCMSHRMSSIMSLCCHAACHFLCHTILLTSAWCLGVWLQNGKRPSAHLVPVCSQRKGRYPIVTSVLTNCE